MLLDRRQFGWLATAAIGGLTSAWASEPGTRFVTRGVILYPWDLSLTDWPERAAQAGLTTIGLHAAQRLDVLIDFVRSEKGEAFLSRCQELGIQVEYELHALGELLSRELYYLDTALFRMDESGQRTHDSNCCPSSKQALEIVAEKAVAVARILRPTTHRYFYWPDDGREWCHCPACRGWTASEQATLVENAIVTALRQHIDAQATLCHIAYHHTLEPPRKIQPLPHLFVEFAPINRDYERSIAERDLRLTHNAPDPHTHGGYLDILQANLEVFGADDAQVLEYWLDVSRFSRWSRPEKKLPWNPQVLRADCNAYAQLGIQHVTSFATWINDRYVKTYGEPPLQEYGAALRGEGA